MISRAELDPLETYLLETSVLCSFLITVNNSLLLPDLQLRGYILFVCLLAFKYNINSITNIIKYFDLEYLPSHNSEIVTHGCNPTLRASIEVASTNDANLPPSLPHATAA